MFKKLEKLINEQQPLIETVDSKNFNNPLASKIDWQPLYCNGSRVQDYFLDDSDPQRIIFKCSKKKYAAAGVFIGIGLVALSLAIMAFFSDANQRLEMFGFAAFFGGVFLIAGTLMWRMTTVPKVFDLENSCYYQAKIKPNQLLDFATQQKTDFTSLSLIKALQIIHKESRHNGQAYASYQLNLILQDASRVNILSHSNYQAIIEGAEVLAKKLTVPLWDGSEQINREKNE